MTRAPLRDRRVAVQRLVALDCGCGDPWTCRHHIEPARTSSAYLDGWVDALNHLLDHNLCPAIPTDLARRIWRHSSDGRTVIAELQRRGAIPQ